MSQSCETRSMNEIRPALNLIESDYNARLEADVARMLEDIPAEDAMQQLRLLRRRIQPAANSCLATVAPATLATLNTSAD
jgi:hypothetical protein